jgi:16S rRNA (guanine527-N7)-methyltransferase
MNDKTDPPFLNLLQQGVTELGLSLSPEAVQLLLEFMAILIKWNKVYNLTAIDNPDDIITHHLLDSLSIVFSIQGEQVLDVGSGAGLPGIPCAIALPEKQFTLLDSNGKKTRFMTAAVGLLGLTNVKIVQSRVEDYKPSTCFDSISVRAFSSIETIQSVTKHLICEQGRLLIMKGTYPHAELQKNSSHATVTRLSIPGLNEERHLVCIEGRSDG